MQALMDALEKIENIIYRIMIWIILIPKTLRKILLDPAWAPGYIKNELNPTSKDKSPFDEYFSPIVLLLVVALVPYLIWSFIPIPGVKISTSTDDVAASGNDADSPSAKRRLNFDAEIQLISTSSSGYITSFWRVEKEDFIVGNYFYPINNLERHTNNPAEYDKCSQALSGKQPSINRGGSIGIANCLTYRPPVPTDYVDYIEIDNHTVQDSFDDTFLPGRYYVVVDVSKFDEQGRQIETYTDEIFVDVPKTPQDQVSIYTKSRPGDIEFSWENVTSQAKSEKTIFLGLGLLIPPLFFALVLKWMDGEDLNEDSIREIFHVQCYYFAPLALIFWATQYARRFITPDVFYGFDTQSKLITLLPLILAGSWFILVQTQAISQHTLQINGEKRKINGLLAFFIALGCVAALIPGILLVFYGGDPAVQEYVRKLSILLYPLLAVGLLTYRILAFSRTGETKPSASPEAKYSDEHSETKVETVLEKEFNKSMEKVLAVQPGIPIEKFLAGGTMLFILITIIWIWKSGASEQLGSQNFDATHQSYATAYSVRNIGTIEIQTLALIPPSTLYANSTSSDISQLATSIMISTNASELPTSTPFAFPSPSASPSVLPATATPEALSTANNQPSPTDISPAEKTAIAAAAFTQLALMPPPTIVPTSTAFPATGGGGRQAPTPVQWLYEQEFNGTLDAGWTSFVTQGDQNAVTISLDGEKLSVSIPQSNDVTPWFYLLNTNSAYEDVQVEADMYNNGDSANGVGLICRANDAGWYEFNVSNSGSYMIYAYDGTYNILEKGKSDAIFDSYYSDSGYFNEYIAICDGDELQLWINDERIITTQDDRFTNGFTGLSVSSPKGQFVSVDFESVLAGQP